MLVARDPQTLGHVLGVQVWECYGPKPQFTNTQGPMCMQVKYFRFNVVYSKIGTRFGNWVADVKGLL